MKSLLKSCRLIYNPEKLRQFETVELLLCITAFLLIFLLIVGPMRRRHRNVVLGPVTVVAYSLSSSLIIYALGLMHNLHVNSDPIFPLWAALLLMVLLGGVDAFSTHSLAKNEDWRSFFVESLYQCFAFGSFLAVGFRKDAKGSAVLVIIIFIFLLTLWKAIERAQSMKSASKSALQKEFKEIADYMSTEHDRSSGMHEVNPVSMRGYKYKVIGDITVEEVWDCKGWLLRSSGGDPHGYLKDICLSFSLFRLLILKYAGYSMPREAYQKTWRLIRDGLQNSSDGHERIFKVIELELAFLFDLFYTKYPIILHPRFWKWKLFRFMTIPAISCATAILLLARYDQCSDVAPFESYGHKNPRVPVTVMLTVIYVVVEFLQLLFTYTSEWAQVTWLCSYVTREKRRGNQHFEKLLKAICSAHFFQWDGKLGQYSLVQCFFYRPPKILYNRLTSFLYDQKRDGKKEIAPDRLPKQVKKEVISSLIRNGGGRLRNGLSSLSRNGLDQLSWACNLKTQTHVILVWHIATFFCEHEVPFPKQVQQQRGNFDAAIEQRENFDPATEQRENFNTATNLSKYLAYLVAFVPGLLPDHPYVTEQVFDQAVVEAREFFKGCKNSRQRIRKLRESDPTDQGVVGHAVRLGKQLREENRKRERDLELNGERDGEFIWKILAEFWVEFALYVTPSDDVEVHVKHLTKGGEFLTHLWALLYHAGFKRHAPPPSEDEGTQRDAHPPSEDEN